MSSSPADDWRLLLLRRLEEAGVRDLFGVRRWRLFTDPSDSRGMLRSHHRSVQEWRRNRSGYKSSVWAIPFAQAPPLSNANSQVMTPPNSID